MEPLEIGIIVRLRRRIRSVPLTELPREVSEGKDLGSDLEIRN